MRVSAAAADRQVLAVADVLVVEAAAVRRLRVAALSYMRRAGTHDPGLLDAIDALWSGGSPRQEFLSVREAAAVLGVGCRTVERWVAGGVIPSARVGGRRLIPADFRQVPPGAAIGEARRSLVGESAVHGDP